MKTYYGKRTVHTSDVRVIADGGTDTLLDIGPSLKVATYARGFEWGYCGRGPSQLATALLLGVTGNADLALKRHTDFMFEVVANLKDHAWQLTEEEIQRWVNQTSQISAPA